MHYYKETAADSGRVTEEQEGLLHRIPGLLKGLGFHMEKGEKTWDCSSMMCIIFNRTIFLLHHGNRT